MSSPSRPPRVMNYQDAPNVFSEEPSWENGDGPQEADSAAPVLEPPAPRTLEETGLSPSFVTELVLKIMHYAEMPTAEHIARTVALPARLLDGLLASLKEGQLCETISSANLLPGQ